MTEHEKRIDPENSPDREHQDQDSEPSKNAPDEARPDLTKATEDRDDDES